ncbi:hypothetical protein AS589_14870 [Empedobacter brevis]|nr:hypothetical protein AS589_14870 [Empedobacter brevis]
MFDLHLNNRITAPSFLKKIEDYFFSQNRPAKTSSQRHLIFCKNQFLFILISDRKILSLRKFNENSCNGNIKKN